MSGFFKSMWHWVFIAYDYELYCYFAGHQENSPLNILSHTHPFNLCYVKHFLNVWLLLSLVPTLSFLPWWVVTSLYSVSGLFRISNPSNFLILHVKINQQIFSAVPWQCPETEDFWPGIPILNWFKLSFALFWIIALASWPVWLRKL